ncbi:MAG: hypothetical protein KH230_18970 [Enterocloster asparagiformis]|nr:hypothetical protein [Enterocloster asparagiformis]
MQRLSWKEAERGGKLLPGDKGQIDIIVDGSSAEVGFDYTISMSYKEGDLTQVKFYKDNLYKQEIDKNGVSAALGYGENEAKTEETVSIYWELPESTGANDDEINDADTQLAGKTASYTIDMKALQHVETSTTE